MTQLKTLAMKAKLANHIRKTIYKKNWTDLTPDQKEGMLMQIFIMGKEMHSELNNFKQKRKDKVKLLAKRKASPLTKSMKKKLGLIPKVKINLENPK